MFFRNDKFVATLLNDDVWVSRLLLHSLLVNSSRHDWAFHIWSEFQWNEKHFQKICFGLPSSDNGVYTPEKCEVDSCNEHIGQGGGWPHLHGDSYDNTCLCSSSMLKLAIILLEQVLQMMATISLEDIWILKHTDIMSR